MQLNKVKHGPRMEHSAKCKLKENSPALMKLKVLIVRTLILVLLKTVFVRIQGNFLMPHQNYAFLDN
jgi:hypothetical protein